MPRQATCPKSSDGRCIRRKKTNIGNEEKIVKVIENALVVAAVCFWETRAKGFTAAIDLCAQRARDGRAGQDIRV
jgi:hypothetical protein